MEQVMISRASSCGNSEMMAIVGYLIALLAMFASSTLYHSFYCLDTAVKCVLASVPTAAAFIVVASIAAAYSAFAAAA